MDFNRACMQRQSFMNLCRTDTLLVVVFSLQPKLSTCHCVITIYGWCIRPDCRLHHSMHALKA